eukprot:COSAG02_NODE_1565_length_11911_cov_10.325940_10_plen_84_part_00
MFIFSVFVLSALGNSTILFVMARSRGCEDRVGQPGRPPARCDGALVAGRSGAAAAVAAGGGRRQLTDRLLRLRRERAVDGTSG